MSVVIGEVAVTMGSQSASIVNMTIQKHSRSAFESSECDRLQRNDNRHQ
jgi:hypothetical protein